MDEATRQAIDEKISRAARLMDEVNNLIRDELIKEVLAAFPTARKINLELEDDDGIQWYNIIAILDADDKDLSVDGDGNELDELLEPLHELASDFFVTPDFGASWVTLEIDTATGKED